jgi:mannose-6-phosphate isomerase-like protein (cupin superfamily)
VFRHGNSAYTLANPFYFAKLARLRFAIVQTERKKQVKIWICAVLACGLALAASATVDVYSAAQLQAMGQKLGAKKQRFDSENLQRYTGHYTMMAYRTATGSSELHQHEADILVIESGDATLVTGGKIVNPHEEKPGEIRGSSIAGGEHRPLAVGDIVHIPANTPHQLLITSGKPFTYFVVKVTGQ